MHHKRSSHSVFVAKKKGLGGAAAWGRLLTRVNNKIKKTTTSEAFLIWKQLYD